MFLFLTEVVWSETSLCFAAYVAVDLDDEKELHSETTLDIPGCFSLLFVVRVVRKSSNRKTPNCNGGTAGTLYRAQEAVLKKNFLFHSTFAHQLRWHC